MKIQIAMPWKETTIMEQKIEFICEWRTGKYTITELCRAFEISRPTAYKIMPDLKMKGRRAQRAVQKTSWNPSECHR